MEPIKIKEEEEEILVFFFLILEEDNYKVYYNIDVDNNYSFD